MNIKIIGGTVAAFLLGTVLILLAFAVDKCTEVRAVNVLALVSGAAVGWLLGVAVSPYDAREASAFPKYAGAVSAFVSGYVVSKLDRVLEHLLRPEFVASAVGAFRLLGGFCALILALLLTYIYRSYVR